MNLTMVFTYVNYLKSWECKLTDNITKRHYWGYADSPYKAMTEAVFDYNNYNEKSIKI